MVASDQAAQPAVSTADSYLDALEGTPAASSIPVHISYEIIRLFSEGLYQSPQKAIEELVSNSYDAGADRVHVVLPDKSSGSETADSQAMPPLWVIDNGHGLDAEGFVQLWRVADSQKANASPDIQKRAPIGQFGIGKLAAYVLAWRLTHLSCVDGVIRVTSMNFRRLAGVHQYDNLSPLDLSLRVISTDQAKEILGDLRDRDPHAWQMLFGEGPAKTWTAAGLSDFKGLYGKLSTGRLSWVLRTGLPLHTDFRLWLNGTELNSSKLSLAEIKDYAIGGDDAVAASLGLQTSPEGIIIDGIEGEITGKATIYAAKLTEGKSDQYGRSHGFFVRVRGRVVNLEDELFGLDALNHAAWSRFAMEITADGLREHLLSSREGVRESDPIRSLQSYMHGVFNLCRRAFDEHKDRETAGLDIKRLLSDAPSIYVTEPLVASVTRAIVNNEESYYVAAPDLPAGTDRAAWLSGFSAEIADTPFDRVMFEPTGIYDRAVRYIPESRNLVINTDHPFIEKLLETSKNRASATLFGSSELLVDVLMQEHGFTREATIDFLGDRDRILRLVAGDEPSTAAEVLRLLQSATAHETALERAVGHAFRVLGFEYERRGGNVPGADGVLYARLGRGIESLSDYKVVYDSKQTNSPSVAADKINLGSIKDFRIEESAEFAFFLAVAYDAQMDPAGKLNRLVATASRQAEDRVTLLRVEDLRRLVELHYRYGVTLTRLRSLFLEAFTVPQVNRWIDDLENELGNLEPQVPLLTLLLSLEEAKSDRLARPNVYAVRIMNADLARFEPERLVASLQAVETIIGARWIEVEKSGDIRLHHTAGQIVAEVERHLRDLFGVNAIERPPLK